MPAAAGRPVAAARGLRCCRAGRRREFAPCSKWAPRKIEVAVNVRGPPAALAQSRAQEEGARALARRHSHPVRSAHLTNRGRYKRARANGAFASGGERAPAPCTWQAFGWTTARTRPRSWCVGGVGWRAEGKPTKMSGRKCSIASRVRMFSWSRPDSTKELVRGGRNVEGRGRAQAVLT